MGKADGWDYLSVWVGFELEEDKLFFQRIWQVGDSILLLAQWKLVYSFRHHDGHVKFIFSIYRKWSDNHSGITCSVSSTLACCIKTVITPDTIKAKMIGIMLAEFIGTTMDVSQWKRKVLIVCRSPVAWWLCFFTCFMKPLLYEAVELHEKNGHVQLEVSLLMTQSALSLEVVRLTLPCTSHDCLEWLQAAQLWHIKQQLLVYRSLVHKNGWCIYFVVFTWNVDGKEEEHFSCLLPEDFTTSFSS